MKILFIISLLILIIVGIIIFYLTSYNKLNTLNIKMEKSDKNIKKKLREKYKLMETLSKIIHKKVKDKDYLKGFNEVKDKKLNNYDLDIELNNYLETMIELKEDYKLLDTNEYNDTLLKIKEIDQDLTANKKYFNESNNELFKVLKGHYKIVAKINKINTKTSYEIKEPIKD